MGLSLLPSSKNETKESHVWIGYQENFFTERVGKHQNRLPREMVGSASQEVLKKHVAHVVLGTWFRGEHDDTGLMVGLDDL